MDFLERLIDGINNNQLPLRIRSGYLSSTESLCVYPLPGSNVTQLYMDGTKDMNMNYEIAMKSKDATKINNVLWKIQDILESLKDLKSDDDSFSFNELDITSKPFINEQDEQGWFVFLLDIQAKLTLYK